MTSPQPQPLSQPAPIESAPIFDADQHMYETPEALTRYLPERFRADGAVRAGGAAHPDRDPGQDHRVHPEPDLRAGGRARARTRSSTPAEHRGQVAARDDRQRRSTPSPAFREPGPRVGRLDAQGVPSRSIYPTLANLVEHSAAEDPELVVAMIHALNRWMLDTWGYTYDDRLFMTPVITLRARRRRAVGSSSTCWRTAPRWC